MNSINLNDSKFESKQFRPFNDGQAGIAEVRVSEISQNSEKSHWFIIFEDSNGAQLRDYQSYIPDEHPRFGEMLQAQGTVLRHYWEIVVGNSNIPDFENAKDMLDRVMSVLRENINGKSFRLAVDYGNGSRHSQYLQRKRYVPFIENATDEPSALKLDYNSHTEPASDENSEKPVQSVQSLNSDSDDSWLKE